jgi:hypothetical protein
MGTKVVQETVAGGVSIGDQIWTLTQEIFVTQERGQYNIIPLDALRKFARQTGRLFALLAEGEVSNTGYAKAYAPKLLPIRYPTIKTLSQPDQAKRLNTVITELKNRLSDMSKSAKLVAGWIGEPTEGQHREASFAYRGATDRWADSAKTTRKQSPSASRVSKAGAIGASLVQTGMGEDSVELVDVFYALIHGVLAIPAHTVDMVTDAFLAAMDKATTDRKQQALTDDMRRDARNKALGNVPRPVKAPSKGQGQGKGRLTRRAKAFLVAIDEQTRAATGSKVQGERKVDRVADTPAIVESAEENVFESAAPFPDALAAAV